MLRANVSAFEEKLVASYVPIGALFRLDLTNAVLTDPCWFWFLLHQQTDPSFWSGLDGLLSNNCIGKLFFHSAELVSINYRCKMKPLSGLCFKSSRSLLTKYLYFEHLQSICQNLLCTVLVEQNNTIFLFDLKLKYAISFVR